MFMRSIAESIGDAEAEFTAVRNSLKYSMICGVGILPAL